MDDVWQCRVCAAKNVMADHGADRCWACGRARPSVDWSKRLSRVGAIIFGFALQLSAGVLFWIYPPGVSVGSWLLYLAMGLAGFLHIFIGGEMLRRQMQRDQPKQEPIFSAASLPHATGEPQSLAPGEMRMNGAAIVVLVLALAIVSCVLLTVVAGP